MNDMKIPVEVDPTEDTEWNDILREKGIIPERPPSPTEELDAALEEAVRKQHENRLESKDLDELDELEDDEDEEFLNFYKMKRVQELKKLSERKKYGSVQNITKPEYEKEVTLASELHNGTYVLLHMSLQSNLQSRLLSSIFITLATKFPEIKFADIPANRCVENYPESNCPTIIVYYKKDVKKQFITLTQLGGNDTRLKDLENVLIDIQAVDINDKRLTINQIDEDVEEEKKLRFMKKSIRGGRKNVYGDDDDEDEDDDDFYD